MRQLVKMLSAKFANLSLIPGTLIVEAGLCPPRVCVCVTPTAPPQLPTNKSMLFLKSALLILCYVLCLL